MAEGTITWRELEKLISEEIPEDKKDQTVCMSDGGSETYASELENFHGNPILIGF